MQITATWGEEEVAVEVEAECRTLAALKALLQDALPEVDVGTVRLEVGGRELTDDDDVCGLEAGSVVELSVTAAVLAAATLREEGWEVDLRGICHAAREGDMRRVGLYLDAGVPCIPGEWSPLHYAGYCDQVEVARLLLDRGAVIDAKGPTDITPLHVACSLDNVVLATLLLDRGTAIDEKDSDGDTPLHGACAHNNIETVTLLLDRGAATDAKGSDSNTPLHVACSGNNIEIATLLLDRSVAIDEKSTSGSTPLSSACLSNYRAMVRLLLGRGAAVDADILYIAQRSGDNEMIALLSGAKTAS